MNMITLKMDSNTLDVLSHAVDNLRDDINSKRLAIDDEIVDDFITELVQLEYLISVANEELKSNA